jgi:hypothetical protein
MNNKKIKNEKTKKKLPTPTCPTYKEISGMR